MKIQIQTSFGQVCNLSFNQAVFQALAGRMGFSDLCLKFVVDVQNQHGTRLVGAVRMAWISE